MKPTYDEYMAELSAELAAELRAPYDPFRLSREFTAFRKADDAHYLRTTGETVAAFGSAGDRLDAVPRMLVKMVVP
jgi:hypothetical protein